MITLVILVVIILGGVGFFVLSQKSPPAKTSQPSADTNSPEESVLSLKPSDIGLTLTLITEGKHAGHGVLMRITKIDDVTSVDYELSYNATNPNDPSQKIPRGAIGHSDIKPTDTDIHQEIPFGTCSDKCHYDTGISDVKLILKVTKKDNKTYQVQANLDV